MKIYCLLVSFIKINSIVDKFSLDEISIHVMMKPNYSRCELGKYTIVFTISSKGVICWKIYEKRYDWKRMVEFNYPLEP